MAGYSPTQNVRPGGGYDFNKLPDVPSLAQVAAQQAQQQPVQPLGGIPGGQWLVDQGNSLAAYLQNAARQAAGGFQNFASGGRDRPYRTDYNAPPQNPLIKR